MDIAGAARIVNDVAYGYVGSWALLTACRERLFDLLPARPEELAERYPDAALVATWLRTLEQDGIVVETGGRWSVTDAMAPLLVGDDSYSEYLGGQVLRQMVPRLLGPSGTNPLVDALRDPGSRTGYAGWFADAAEAERYQASQYAGSLGPARTIAKRLAPQGRVLDLGGGWGGVAAAVATRHGVAVDVVDLAPVVESAPESPGVRFVAGDALDPDTWPDEDYDGVVLSYLLSSLPGPAHQPVVEAIAARGARWVAVHDFLLGGGTLAAAWSLQHAVFVPDHHSRSVDEVAGMLAVAGYVDFESAAVVDEMTTMVVAAAGSAGTRT